MSKILLSTMAPEDSKFALECLEMLVQKILEVSNLIIQLPAMPYIKIKANVVEGKVECDDKVR